MNANQLYEELKNALRFFNLKWNEKDKMGVRFEDGEVIFSHGAGAVVIDGDRYNAMLERGVETRDEQNTKSRAEKKKLDEEFGK